jgi:hypothetical protein
MNVIIVSGTRVVFGSALCLPGGVVRGPVAAA